MARRRRRGRGILRRILGRRASSPLFMVILTIGIFVFVSPVRNFVMKLLGKG